MEMIKKHANTILMTGVTLAAYLVGVIPAEGGFSDVTTVQWLGAVVFVGAAFGVNRVTRDHDPSVLARLDNGRIVAGDAAPRPTGEVLSSHIRVGELLEPDQPR